LNQSTNYFPALTGVRACAAYVVFLTHFNPFLEFGWPWQLAHEGNSGVTVFFVLSGFLIAYRYAERIAVSRQWLATYIRNRVARIYPLYFLLTALTFAFIEMDPVYDIMGRWAGYVASDKAVAMALNFTLTRAFFENFKFTGIPQGWTLTVEECFYFLAPVLLLGLVRTRHRWALLLAYGVALLGIGCALVVWAPHKLSFFASYNFMLTYTFFGRCGEFLCGMALAFFVHRRADRVATLRPAYYTWMGLVWMALCVIGGAIVNPTTESPVSYSPAGLVLNNLLLPVGIAVFFLGLLWEDTRVRRLLETRVFDLLGKSSYAFYLVHMGIFSRLLDLHVTRHYGFHFVFMLGLSVVLYRYVEKPLHKLLVVRSKTLKRSVLAQ